MAGGSKVTWRGKQISGEAHRAAAEGIEDACYALLDDSSRLVPLEEGTLEQSGGVEVDKSALEGVVYYNTAYAVKQHEDMSLRHPNGRQAKYLEQPLKQRGKEYEAHIASKVENALS